MIEINKLNDKQKEAVLTSDGALLILAGAGSGKTRVITNKIAYLIEEKNVQAYNILAITFTNKAAKEMQKRVQELIGLDSKKVWISTFHAFCTRILRYEADNIDYENNFTIYDTQDKQVLLKNCIDTLGYNKETLNINIVSSEISRAKDSMISVDEYDSAYEFDYLKNKIAKVYRLYQEELIKNNAMDFDDLIFNCITLFKNNKSVLEKYQDKFMYIMVDEYQDTNYSQYLLIKMLSSKHKNICVVGDDDQSIYGWRGADIRNILEFEQDFENVKQIKLEQNYRSSSNIINAARGLIKNNQGRKDKRIWTSSGEGEKITIYEATSENDESNYVAENIKKFMEKGYNYSDFAVLYRANALSRKYEEAFMKYKIPYRIFGGLKFYDRMEIKDILAYFRIIDNKNDDVSLKRIINVPKRSIGVKSLEKLQDYANEKRMSLLDSIFSILNNQEEINKVFTSSKTRDSIKKFAIMINSLKSFAKVLPISKLLEKVLLETNYEQSLLQEKTLESQSRLENIKELASVILEFEKLNENTTLSDFLQNATLSTDMDENSSDNDYVTLMTIHSSKGLEFPIVFMVATEENIFPASKSSLDEVKLEEERRLCYVAITRAKDKLFITRAKSRLLYGNTNCNMASRFIKEIDKDLVVNEKQNVYMSTEDTKTYSLHQQYIEKYKLIHEKKKEDAQQINIGAKVKHKVFGQGMVVGKTGSKYSIVFDKIGVKNIDTTVVKLELL